MGLLSVPLKTVLMYHADLQNEAVPESYVVCDGSTLTSGNQDINPGGTYTVPDLRNRFILGADLTKAATTAGGTTNAASDAPGPKGVGGAHSKTLATAELPAHSHTGSVATSGGHTHAGSTADSGGAHVHTATTTTAGAHTHAGSSTSTAAAHNHAGSTNAVAGSHTHTVSGGVIGMINNGGFGSGSSGLSLGNIVIDASGSHTHTITITADGGHSHTVNLTTDGDHTHPITVTSGGTHTHTLTLASDGLHTHNFTGDPTGGGTAFDTRPRYYGLVFIMKVKK